MIEKQENGRRTYSDGAETEKSMLELAEKYSEEEISERIAGDAHYLINNTFSPVRRNLLDWYPFREGCSILEVGAGMGSLTSLLCEKAAHVTAVELGEDRAKVIRARCKDKTNLSIYSDDILTWDNGERFDYVVMVGVLEYAAVFSHSETPFDDFLARLKGFMKPGGVLLFAIENQFGLKYWLGASEDHLQRPYAGIEKYTESGTARTFSKAQLTFMCRRQGWETRFYYLLPDYRFPTAVFTDESLPGFQDVRNVRYTYSLNSCLTADERELYRDVIENNVFPFFANSYLVEAAEVLPGEHVIRVSGRSEVRAEQRIITYIDNSGQVWKRAQSREAQRHIERAYEHEQYLRARGVNCIPSELEGDRLKMPFCGEKLADREFCLALEKGDTEKAHAMIDALRSALEKSSDLTDTPNEKLLALGGCQEEQLLAHGADGLVFGFLNPDGTLDKARTKELVRLAGKKTKVFHRAIDVAPDWKEMLSQLIELGVDRVLTSGLAPDVFYGVDTIREMVEFAQGAIEILPGAGVNLKNVDRILDATGCGQIHVASFMQRYDTSTQNNRDIFYGGALYPPEDCYDVINGAYIAEIRAHGETTMR